MLGSKDPSPVNWKCRRWIHLIACLIAIGPETTYVYTLLTCACSSREVKILGRSISHAMIPGQIRCRTQPFSGMVAVSLVSPIAGSFPYDQIWTLNHEWGFKPSQKLHHNAKSKLLFGNYLLVLLVINKKKIVTWSMSADKALSENTLSRTKAP